MNSPDHKRVVRVLVPTEAAARWLTREFPLANLAMDGTLMTVLVYGISYADVVARIREWMNSSRIGPVLVTDDRTGEELLPGFNRQGRDLKP